MNVLYVHRVGRTARVGKSGKSLVIMSPEQKVYLENLASSGVRVQTTQVSDILNEAFQSKNEQIAREAASAVQRAYENYVNDDAHRSVKALAIDTYAQFLRSYATYRKEIGFVAKDLRLVGNLCVCKYFLNFITDRF